MTGVLTVMTTILVIKTLVTAKVVMMIRSKLTR